MKASESQWSNQFNISYKKFLPGKKNNMNMEIPAWVQYHEMSVTINKCQISFLEMLGTYSIAGIYMKLSGIEMSCT